MAYDYLTKTFNNVRPAFISEGRENIIHPSMRLDHRIPWSTIRIALNRVLNDEADHDIVNNLMMLSPDRNPLIMKHFTTAVKECRRGRDKPPQQRMDVFNHIERQLFSLPVNLSLGINHRSDDPETNMDFTPDDIDWNGLPMQSSAGELQRLRENLFKELSAQRMNSGTIRVACLNIVKAVGPKNLNKATAANYNNWHPGPTPVEHGRTTPGYRYWQKPSQNGP